MMTGLFRSTVPTVSDSIGIGNDNLPQDEYGPAWFLTDRSRCSVCSRYLVSSQGTLAPETRIRLSSSVARVKDGRG